MEKLVSRAPSEYKPPGRDSLFSPASQPLDESNNQSLNQSGVIVLDDLVELHDANLRQPAAVVREMNLDDIDVLDPMMHHG